MLLNSLDGIGSCTCSDTCAVGSYVPPTFWSNATMTAVMLNCASSSTEATPAASISLCRHGIVGLSM